MRILFKLHSNKSLSIPARKERNMFISLQTITMSCMHASQAPSRASYHHLIGTSNSGGASRPPKSIELLADPGRIANRVEKSR